MKRAHLIISGDVTGVGFRSWTVRYAKELDLSGWVRNTDRNTVEAVFEGPRDKLDEMIKRCQHGPEVAWVEKVDITWEDSTDEFVGFEIRY